MQWWEIKGNKIMDNNINNNRENTGKRNEEDSTDQKISGVQGSVVSKWTRNEQDNASQTPSGVQSLVVAKKYGSTSGTNTKTNQDQMQQEQKKKRGRRKNQEQEASETKDQDKFFIDVSKNEEQKQLIQNLLNQANNKKHGREIILKDLMLISLPKITIKEIEKLQENSLTEMEKVSKALDEYNKKAEVKLTLGEFLVKKLALQ